MTTAVRTLLAEILEAHGGIDRWRIFTQVTAKVVTGSFGAMTIKWRSRVERAQCI
jgi:hypothetical protein